MGSHPPEGDWPHSGAFLLQKCNTFGSGTAWKATGKVVWGVNLFLFLKRSKGGRPIP